jgi:hypothetical protein
MNLNEECLLQFLRKNRSIPAGKPQQQETVPAILPLKEPRLEKTRPAFTSKPHPSRDACT